MLASYHGFVIQGDLPIVERLDSVRYVSNHTGKRKRVSRAGNAKRARASVDEILSWLVSNPESVTAAFGGSGSSGSSTLSTNMLCSILENEQPSFHAADVFATVFNAHHANRLHRIHMAFISPECVFEDADSRCLTLAEQDDLANDCPV